MYLIFNLLKIKIFLSFVALSALFLACSPPQRSSDRRLDMIHGTWYASHKGLYHTLYFQDSTHIGLDTHIDTTFFYDYKIIGDSLALYKPHGELLNYNPILKLTPDTLVFEYLLDRGKIACYSRRKRL
ncbi:MAG: hypothetical protein EAZ95_02625 [Bacteroidetes bacterium]|nr:MAG: hypothetical protein EAZ95_02625 [Bacteroidota bacterium]